MAIISYYLATSLDGYLAREDGTVDWLNPYQSKLNTPYDYEIYYQDVTIVIMGRNTWEVAKSFEENPYSDRRTIIYSSKLKQEELPKYAELIQKLDIHFLNQLKKESKGKIWIVGGAQLASKLLEINMVDEIVQTIVPVTLGEGIRWILPNQSSLTWNLNDVFKCDKGVVQLIYNRKNT